MLHYRKPETGNRKPETGNWKTKNKKRMKGYFLKTDSVDAAYNLTLEEYLLGVAEMTTKPLLYLWQNRDAVIIGRNQNAYTECNLEYAKSEGVQVIRRLTGGGAVYHDLGNINFSYIVPRESYDINSSMNLIAEALKSLGVKVEISGRNDLCLEGRKISGNAYHLGRKTALHHGTILYRLNLERMEKLLFVSKEKLAKKGIKSVRSRVTDLSSCYPKLTIEDIYSAIKGSFVSHYGLTDLEDINTIDKSSFDELLKKYSSDKWNLDRIRDYEKKETILSGRLCLSYLYEGDKLKAVELASDALNADKIDELRIKLNQEISAHGCIVSDLEDLFLAL